MAISGFQPASGSTPALITGPSEPMLQAGTATMVGQLAGQPTPGVPLLNDTTGTTNFNAGDLGIMWDDGHSHTMVAYGDSFGHGFEPSPNGGPGNGDGHLCNALALSSTPASSLSTAMSLSFVTDSSGAAKSMIPCAADSSAAAIIPTAGVSVNGTNYVDFMSVHHWGAPGVWQTNHAELAQSTDDGRTWTAEPGAQWVNNSSYTDNFQQAALASVGGYVYMFSTPNGRFGNAYLARVPDTHVADGADYEYWTGTGWQAGADTLAAPVVSGPVAELSVQYNVGLGLWLMTYLDTPRGAIVLRYAQSPRGPWSGEQVIVQQSSMPPGTGGIYGGFMHPWSTGTDLYLTVSAWYSYQAYLMHVPLTLSYGSGMNMVSDGAFGDPMDGYSHSTAPPGVFGWSSDGRAGVDVGLGNGLQTPNNGWARNNVNIFNDLYQTISVVPGSRYLFTVWIRTSSTNVAAYVGVRNAAHNQYWQAGPIGAIGRYMQYSISFNSGDNSQVQVFAGTWPRSGVDTWIQMDKFQLTPEPVVFPSGGGQLPHVLTAKCPCTAPLPAPVVQNLRRVTEQHLLMTRVSSLDHSSGSGVGLKGRVVRVAGLYFKCRV
jgi:hypothetical protein